MYRHGLKRILDITLSVIALCAISPILVGLAIAIKLSDRGPIVFSHTRIGCQGTPFLFYKFRSMPVGTKNLPSDQIGTIQIGRVGRFLRRSNLDELPQLFNILKGDMSIVGPRPSIPTQTDLIALRRENGALACRPGLTGLAQICSFDGMTAAEKADFDGTYAQNISLLGDISIILRTAGYLLRPPPTY